MVTISLGFGVTQLQDGAEYLRHRIADVSLMHGWLPPTIHVATLILLGCAIRWRSRRGWSLHLPVAVGLGVLLATSLHWYIGSAGLAGEPAPHALWGWLVLSGLAFGVLAMGWRGAKWRRRAAALSATSLCLLSGVLVLNAWVGYAPTVFSAWNQLTAGPLPDQADPATVAAMQRAGIVPPKGVVLPVTINGAASAFKHRGELVYLPPTWFSPTPPPPLPVVMMVGAEINTPADWLRAGDAVSTADAFAAAHGGTAPVLVFVDSGGAFGIDTECVNGPRGNAADHLAKDVVPFMIANFGVSASRDHWGVAGFSTGGTCALDLTVMHPDLFSSFLDIAGDAGPNAGTAEQTVQRLFGGDAEASASFDPATVMIRHGPYDGLSGWFAVAPAHNHAANQGGQNAAAHSLCDLAGTQGIECSVVEQPGKHDWTFAAEAFGAALPWLAGRLSTPGAPRLELPGTGHILAAPPAASSQPPVRAAGR